MKILAITIFASLVLSATASAAVGHTCGDFSACPSRARGHLSMVNAQRDVAAEITSEYLPMAETVVGCVRRTRAEVRCGVAVGTVTYGPLGCMPGSACPTAQTVLSQSLVMFARRIGRHSVLVWYGPGKPEGINYVVHS